jgi:hypothetical protein
MATIPQYVAGNVLDPRSAPRVSVDTSGADAIRSFGGALGNLGDALRVQREQALAGQTEASFSDERAKIGLWAAQRQQELRLSATSDSPDYTPALRKDLASYSQTVLARNPSPEFKAAWARWFPTFQAGLELEGMQDATAGLAAKRGTVLTNTLNTHLQVITADPAKFNVVYNRAMDDLAGARSWMTPEQEEKARGEFDRSAKIARAKAAIQLNPEAFLSDIGVTLPGQPFDPVQTVANRIMGAESGFDPGAANDRSSASGVGQFIDSTWLDTVRKHRPDLAGLPKEEILRLKSDPMLGREMTIAHTRDNADVLINAGQPVTPANLYLAHFAGSDGAVRVLTASDDRSVESVLGPRAVRDNPQLQGKNIGWLKQWAADKMGVSGGPTAPALDLGPDTQLDAGTFKSRHYTWQDLRNDRWSTSTVSSRAVTALDWVTDQFGSKLKITSGYRAPNHPAERAKAQPGQHTHGQAIDIDVSGLSDAERSRVVALFVQAGARGLGHYPPGSGGAGTIHVDFRAGRGKQPDGLALWYGGQSVEAGEAWFKAGIEQGRAARGTGSPAGSGGMGSTFSVAGNPYYEGLSPDDVWQLKSQAETIIRQRQTDDAIGSAMRKVQAESFIASDLSSIANTGQPLNQGMDIDAIREALGPERAFEYLRNRDQAQSIYAATAPLKIAPTDEMQARVAAFEPDPGDPDFARRQAVYEAAKRVAEEQAKLRDTDPGKAAEAMPPVTAAMKALAANPTAANYQALAQARLDAQAALGIPVPLRSPVTKDEARMLGAPIRALTLKDPGAKAAVDAVLTTVMQRYGEYGDEAMRVIIRNFVEDDDLATIASAVLGKLMRGERITPAEGAKVDALSEARQAADALGAPSSNAPVAPPAPSSAPREVPPELQPFRPAGNPNPFAPSAAPSGSSGLLPGAPADLNAAMEQAPGLRPYDPGPLTNEQVRNSLSPPDLIGGGVAADSAFEDNARLLRLDPTPAAKRAFDAVYGEGAADRTLTQSPTGAPSSRAR